MDPMVAFPHWEALARETLTSLGPSDLGRTAAASSAWRGTAEHDDVWQELCRRRWSSQRWTAHSAAGLVRLLRGDRLTSDPLEQARTAAATATATAAADDDDDRDAETGVAVAALAALAAEQPPSWREAYRSAEEAAAEVAPQDLYGDLGGAPRVWVIHQCPPPFSGPNQAVFRRDGTYSDTALFRGIHGQFSLARLRLQDGGDDDDDDEDEGDVQSDDETEAGAGSGSRLGRGRRLAAARTIGLQLSFGGRQIAGIFTAHRREDWGIELRAFGRGGPYFAATDRPVTEAWEGWVMGMDPLLSDPEAM
mmetsp:Transcript_5599/g.13778  ORF Transcript_5599/g.13778 Transcript_5599/m.13778 type:complete len:308 (+) Transcript_5599:120-1043(+)